MTGFLIDTNVPSEVTKQRPHPRVEAWIADPGAPLYVSVVTLGELRKGIALLSPEDGRRRRLERWFQDDLLTICSGGILPLTRPIAERWGALEAERQLRGRPLSSTDGQIAATALEHGLSLVTRNVADFEGLGIEILNPWDD
ncbi:MAG: type II toxin-antitoxin system VapC family toxin [Bryobacterales bacterium]|nr:type II toxin-antitoxin system VapC family toxin [Acidobacteriota bacterium]MCB9384336.1 type II toxin-antitoxin system VapC family toxin [Bryobacterales bacterium]